MAHFAVFSVVASRAFLACFVRDYGDFNFLAGVDYIAFGTELVRFHAEWEQISTLDISTWMLLASVADAVHRHGTGRTPAEGWAVAARNFAVLV